MAESKILDDDRDEWFYNSLQRYTNLYMFDLEFPVDAMEIIDDTSICLSGMQNYSNKCEILQLSVPIKLLPKHIEDGLCKDRDFKILSGGYSPKRITKIKPLPAFPNFLTTIQSGEGGCTIFKLGDDQHGVIQKESILTSDQLSSSSSTTLATMQNKIVVNSTQKSADGENVAYLWALGANDMKSSNPVQLVIPSKVSEIGTISKIKFWDENTLALCSTKGFVSLFDIRDQKISLEAVVPKAPMNESAQYSFDCISSLNLIGRVDTNGGYISVDARKINKDTNRTRQLPELPDVNTVIGGKFNLEYDLKLSDDESIVKFVVTGMKQDTVPVFVEKFNSEEISSVFTHDGHSKTVTHVCWHTLTEKLLFSASVDSVLHAWQYIG